MKILTVLKCGGEYNEGHVQWITRQLTDCEVSCLTDSTMPDDDFKGVTGAKKLPLYYGAWGARGWWAKMEMFRPDLHGDFLYVDLDTVFLRTPKSFDGLSGPCVLADFYFPQTSVGSGLMYLPESCRGPIWENWERFPHDHIARNHGDQDFLTPLLWPAERWQNKFPYNVVSYKAHLSKEDGQQFYKGGYDDMSQISVVCFHGKPRPWEVQHKHGWIPR